VSHCGAGCILGHLVGGWIVYLTAWRIGISGSAGSLSAIYLADLVLAWSLAIAFQ